MIKKIVIGLMLIILLCVGVAFYKAPSFIDKEAVRAEIVSSFKSLTGYAVEIEGEVLVERFPIPHIVVNSMYVHNVPGGISPFLLTAKLAEIWPSYKSLFHKNIVIQKIDVDDVEIDVEHLKNGQDNWKKVMAQDPASAGALDSTVAAGMVGAYVNITNGYIHYTNEETKESSEYRNIKVAFLYGGAQSESTVRGQVTYVDKDIAFSGNIGNILHALTRGEVPAELTIKSNKSELKYVGSMGVRDGKPSVSGSIKITTDDIVPWISLMEGVTEKNPEDTENNAESYKKLPLDISSDISTSNDTVTFPDIALEGAIVKGHVTVALSPPYGIDVKASLDVLDLETLFGSRLFAKEEGESSKADKSTQFIVAPKSFLDSLNLSAEIKIKDTLYNQRDIRNTRIQLDMSNGEMTVSQAIADLPGDSRVVFAGIGKEGFKGFALEGQLDMAGADFAEMAKLLKSHNIALPVQDFKRFHINANAIISPTELRLSEIAARIENMAFVGGFIMTFDKRVRIEAAMRLGGINIDHFAQLWEIPEWRASLSETTLDARKDPFLMRLMRQLDFDISMNVALEEFFLNGNTHDKADFRFKATRGKVSLTDIKTTYNGSNITGNFSLDVNNVFPKIDVKAVMDTFDADTFFTPDGKPAPALAQPVTAVVGATSSAGTVGPPPASATVNASADSTASRWSSKPFDFHWLDFMTLNFHFKFDQYKQGTITAHTVEILGGVENRTLNIESITGYVLGAQAAGKAFIVGGKIPTINIAANINSVDPTQLVPYLPVLEGMTGKYNLSIRLDATGLDMISWISSLEGTVGVGGENVNIHGFNLAGVVHAVAYVRTVADILNVVRRAFPGGDTMFSNIEGQWAVANGTLRTNNSRLVNELANGLMISEVDLVNWQIQTRLDLALKALDAASPPGMTITFSGSLDKPETALDTRSLEQYVTNKTSGDIVNKTY